MARLPRASNQDRRRVVVAGAGIGGLTAALALSAAGFAVLLAERADHLSEVGAGIQLSPNAGRVLAALGLDEAIAATATEPEAIEIRNGMNGRVLATLPIGGFRRRYGFPYRVIHRADLQAVLVGAVANDPAVTLTLGATVAGYIESRDRLLVRIQTTAGTDAIPASALVAADGVWSSLRDRIAGAARAAPTGRTAWRALIPADGARGRVATDRTGLWLGRDAHIVTYPVARGSAVNVVAIIEEKWEQAGWSAVGHRAEITRRFDDWSPEALRLLAAPETWQRFAISRVDPTKSWTGGRVALLGDAAHAMVPFLAQGAAMAIEDAAVLARSLAGTADVATGLSRYQAARKPRGTRVAKAANDAGAQYHCHGALAVARDMALRLMGERLILNRNDWIYRWEAPSAADDGQAPQ